MLEHPIVSQINKTGYPKGFENIVQQQECCGIDYYECEILSGDEVVEFDGELILKDNLERFLSEELGFTFRTAT